MGREGRGVGIGGLGAHRGGFWVLQRPPAPCRPRKAIPAQGRVPRAGDAAGLELTQDGRGSVPGKTRGSIHSLLQSCFPRATGSSCHHPCPFFSSPPSLSPLPPASSRVPSVPSVASCLAARRRGIAARSRAGVAAAGADRAAAARARGTAPRAGRCVRAQLRQAAIQPLLFPSLFQGERQGG